MQLICCYIRLNSVKTSRALSRISMELQTTLMMEVDTIPKRWIVTPYLHG
jgi:hypothetical protein